MERVIEGVTPKCYKCGYSGAFTEEYCGIGFTVKGCKEEDFHNHRSCPQCGSNSVSKISANEIEKEIGNGLQENYIQPR